MLPLYDEIIQNPNYYTVNILENDVKFDELCNYLIQNVGLVLYEVYSAYFPWEIANSSIYKGLEERSEKAYKEFLRDFDICPSIITKTISFQLWNSVIELQNETYRESCETFLLKKAKGKYLTFSKFIDLLVKISYLYAREAQEVPDEFELPSEIFIMLLEKLELSNGFLNLEKKTNKPHISRTSLLPSKEIMTLISNAKEGDAENVVNYIKDKNAKLIQKMENLKLSEGKVVQSHNVPYPSGEISQNYKHIVPPQRNYILPSGYKEQNSHFNESQEYEEESDSEDKNGGLDSDLIQIFNMYCDPTNSSTIHSLTLNEFIEMMMTVIKTRVGNKQFNFPIADIELIYAQISNYGAKNRFTNAQTKNSKNLELFSAGVDLLFRKNIITSQEVIDQEAEKSSEHIVQLMEILKDEEMVNLLELIHQTLYPYFTFYSNEEGLMTADLFVEFCHDFKIFPDILPEEIVMNFFKTLSDFYSTDEHKQTNRGSESNEGVIDEHLFVEVLALSALEMRFQDPQPTQIEKVIVLIDCMNNSNGAKKMYEANGGDPNDQIDLLAIIKQAYPHLFQDC